MWPLLPPSRTEGFLKSLALLFAIQFSKAFLHTSFSCFFAIFFFLLFTPRPCSSYFAFHNSFSSFLHFLIFRLSFFLHFNPFPHFFLFVFFLFASLFIFLIFCLLSFLFRPHKSFSLGSIVIPSYLLSCL
jgi:hypothetical protein